MARLQSAARSRFRMATVSRHCIGLMGAQFLVFDDDTAVGCQYSSPLWMGDTCGRESQCGDLHMT